jgi:hypothetical protein
MSPRATIALLAALIATTPATRCGAQGLPPITHATISNQIPTEVVDGTNNPVQPGGPFPLDFFDDFSWREFVALNWPALGGQRGVPDPSKSVGDSGQRVWETWKTAYETIPGDGSAPTDWTSFDALTPCPGIPSQGSSHQRLFASFKPFGDFNEAGFDVVGLPLICQNGTYSRFEIRVNQTEYNDIRTNKLYLRSTLNNLAQQGAPVFKFHDNSIELKAAWRDMEGESPDFVKTFYTVQAKVWTWDPTTNTGSCVPRTMGLVGLHIVQKTPLRPQWVWSSFEHVSNVPKFGIPPAPGTRLSYNNPMKPQATDGQPDTGPNPLSAANFKQQPMPTQVKREQQLHPAAAGNQGTDATNQRYQAALAGTVWANYQLVVTQWPTDPSNVNDPSGVPFPDANGLSSVLNQAPVSSTNTTMETYNQTSMSCLNCHSVSKSENLDFVFFLDFEAFNDTTQKNVKPLVLEGLKAKIREARLRSRR